MARESAEAAALRWKMLRMVQEAYPTFGPFLDTAMEVLGFGATDIQHDIGEWLGTPADTLTEAQRGQAKSTVACIRAVWTLVHDPKHRHLIVSGGEDKAKENSHLIISLLTSMEELKCMLPDPQNGDRTSVQEFDIHYSLKGISASPSVRCLGITANMQGFRADTLTADDIETQRNSETQIQREKLLARVNDFASICVGRPEDGVPARMNFLGTPQTRDSVYNVLPSKGVQVRIWPGRYPTEEQLKNYGGMIAPLLLQRLIDNPALGIGGGADGSQGQPTDPKLKNEDTLRRIELRQGKPFFELQHMLSTALTDKNRFPLLSSQLILVSSVVPSQVPTNIARSIVPQTLLPWSMGTQTWHLQSPVNVSTDSVDATSRVVAYVDPAPGGANGDETAYAVGLIANATVWLLSVGGFRGGYDIAVLEELAMRLALLRPALVIVEKNLGHGAFREVFMPVMKRACEGFSPGFADDLVGSTMKERRIISTLAPVIGRGSLVVTQGALDQDLSDCERYGAEERVGRSFMFQMTRMQAIKGALKHDDRADAVAGLVGHFSAELATLEDAKTARISEAEYRAQIARSLGHRVAPVGGVRRTGNITLRSRRR